MIPPHAPRSPVPLGPCLDGQPQKNNAKQGKKNKKGPLVCLAHRVFYFTVLATHSRIRAILLRVCVRLSSLLLLFIQQERTTKKEEKEINIYFFCSL